MSVLVLPPGYQWENFFSSLRHSVLMTISNILSDIEVLRVRHSIKT